MCAKSNRRNEHASTQTTARIYVSYSLSFIEGQASALEFLADFKGCSGSSD